MDGPEEERITAEHGRANSEDCGDTERAFYFPTPTGNKIPLEPIVQTTVAEEKQYAGAVQEIRMKRVNPFGAQDLGNY